MIPSSSKTRKRHQLFTPYSTMNKSTCILEGKRSICLYFQNSCKLSVEEKIVMSWEVSLAIFYSFKGIVSKLAISLIYDLQKYYTCARGTSTKTFIVSLFATANTWEQPKSIKVRRTNCSDIICGIFYSNEYEWMRVT